jgi:hypothetical protein
MWSTVDFGMSVLVKDLDLSVFFFSDHSVLVMDFKFGV